MSDMTEARTMMMMMSRSKRSLAARNKRGAQANSYSSAPNQTRRAANKRTLGSQNLNGEQSSSPSSLNATTKEEKESQRRLKREQLRRLTTAASSRKQSRRRTVSLPARHKKRVRVSREEQNSRKVNIMRHLLIGLVVVAAVLSIIVLAANRHIRSKREPSPSRFESEFEESIALNRLYSSANIKEEDLSELDVVWKKLQAQQRLNLRNKFYRNPQGFLNRPKRPTPALNPDLPIVVDKIKGIDLSTTHTQRSDKLVLVSNDLPESQRPPKLQSPNYSNNDNILKFKCHNNKYDRIIAQKMSLNNLSRPIVDSSGRFENPFPTWKPLSYMDVVRFMLFESDESSIPKDMEELNRELPIRKPYFLEKTADEQVNNSSDFKVTWIGHSTLLIQVDGLNILTDPVFSERASPSQMFGPQRYRQPACDIASLPKIHIVLVSHDHYDHLDAGSVSEINARFGTQCRWVVPLGLGEFMRSMSVENYVELDWWQKDCYQVGFEEPPSPARMLAPSVASSSPSRPSSGSSSSRPAKARKGLQQTPARHKRDFLMELDPLPPQEPNSTDKHPARARKLTRIDMDIYFVPTQHWGRRTVTDVNRALWGGFVLVSGSGSTFFFAGDTGYCSVFKQIGRVFGPVTGAAIPIGAYKPTWFMAPSHVDPQEAVQIHRDVKSMKSIAIHHGTFALANEFYLEPKRLLKRIMDYRQNSTTGPVAPFISLDHGQTTDFTPSPIR